MTVLNAPLVLTILGVSASGPTKKRNASAIYGQTYQQNFLLDVGENSQKRIMEQDLSLMVDFVVISHRHTDHYAGLVPLLQTMNRMQRIEPLNIYVPELKFFKLFLEISRINFKFVNLVGITTGVSFMQKDLFLEFYKREHGLKEVDTYGVKITSISDVKYDKSRLTELTETETATLFKEKKLTKNGKTLDLEDYIESTKNLINCYYTSDGLFDELLFKDIEKQEEGTLFITECTHYYENDILNSYKTEHTHFQILEEKLKNKKKDTMVVLVHLGQKITDALISKISKEKKLLERNIHFGFESAKILHNYRTNVNNFIKR